MSFNPPIPGATTIISELQVRNNPDLPVALSPYIQGGGLSVATLTDRDLYPAALRMKDVTRCYVESTEKTYVLRGGIANVNWRIEYEFPSPNGSNTGTQILQIGAVLAPQIGLLLTSFAQTLPADLFKPAAGRTWAIASVAGLPDGVTVDAVGKQFLGSPAEDGRFAVVINVVDSVGNRGQYVHLMIVQTLVTGPTTPVVTPQPPQVSNAIPNQIATVGVLFSYQFPANTFLSPDGSPMNYQAVGLPGGLTFNGPTRTISGTATSTNAGANSVQIQAVNASNLTTGATFVLTVEEDLGGVNNQDEWIAYGDPLDADIQESTLPDSVWEADGPYQP